MFAIFQLKLNQNDNEFFSESSIDDVSQETNMHCMSAEVWNNLFGEKMILSFQSVMIIKNKRKFPY